MLEGASVSCMSWLNTVDSPDDQEVGRVSLMSEQRGADQVVIQSRHSLSRIDVTELHERRLVLRLNDYGLSEIKLRPTQYRIAMGSSNNTHLWYMVVLLALLAVVVDQDGAHTEVRDDRRMFLRKLPKHEVAGIAEAEVCCSV